MTVFKIHQPYPGLQEECDRLGLRISTPEDGLEGVWVYNPLGLREVNSFLSALGGFSDSFYSIFTWRIPVEVAAWAVSLPPPERYPADPGTSAYQDLWLFFEKLRAITAKVVD